MSKICELIKEKRIYFDGGMGTMLQKRGLAASESPELWNLQHPDIITDIHRQYLEAGANIITTNTFGVNCLKYSNYEDIIDSAVKCAKNACKDYNNSYLAFDIGPLGKFIEPIGDISFEEAVEIFSKNIRVASKLGVDLIIIETMTDSYETKAAVLAAKENCDVPIFVTNVYDENSKMLTGATPEAMVAMLEGLGVTALGINCSLGPDKMIGIIEKFKHCSSLPIIANPNAGLPVVLDGKTSYSMDAESFSDCAVMLAKAGANILGGCCGTEPEFIRQTVIKTASIPLNNNQNNSTVVSSYTHAVTIGKDPVLIGERINPTGKPKFKQALYENNIDYLVKIGLDQADQGVHILDVNVGLAEIDECEIMQKSILSLQSVCDLPLQIDSNDAAVLEKSMRIYNGKPLINSVNGDDESMNAIFPLVKKYGGVIIALTLDKNGIPSTPERRVGIANRIIEKAKEFGIDKKDIIFDPLAMTISADTQSATITLKTVEMLSKNGYNTILGISNISFGLPNRAIINSSFLTMALQKGLTCAIVNPMSKELIDAYYSFRALADLDNSCKNFINYSDNRNISYEINFSTKELSLAEIIERGLISQIEDKTKDILRIIPPLDLIDNQIIPALNQVGDNFERGVVFLPQLLNSAEAASRAFAIIKDAIPQGELSGNGVILATVKGDIHDIGKNIVKLLLESYGFTVYDLGKNISPESVVAACKQHNCKLVALSALMTTTLDAMKETVKQLKEYDNSIKVMVGGAVLNQKYADLIGADAYGPDAMSAVRFAQEYYK